METLLKELEDKFKVLTNDKKLETLKNLNEIIKKYSFNTTLGITLKHDNDNH